MIKIQLVKLDFGKFFVIYEIDNDKGTVDRN